MFFSFHAAAFARCAALPLACAIAPISVSAQTTWKVSRLDSRSDAGPPRLADSIRCCISGDGRFVAFESWADDLVGDDTNGDWDVFVHDRQTGTFQLASRNSAGIQANTGSGACSLSTDGKVLAFTSPADNLVRNDTNATHDVFVRDLVANKTRVVSIDSAGNRSNSFSFDPSLSADGSCVAFVSFATNLVAGDTNGVGDIFVHDRTTGTTTRVSVSSAGVEADRTCSSPAISADGRYVAFWSGATNLVPGDTNGWTDVFVHDRVTGTTVRVSVDSNGAQAENGGSGKPSISADGRFVAFESNADNLVALDTNRQSDIFVHDLQAGTTIRVNVETSGRQADLGGLGASISADGTRVAFFSPATNLVRGDHNGALDVFVRDLRHSTTKLVSRSVGDADGNASVTANARSLEPSISADGRFVAFRSPATDLVLDDVEDGVDIYVRGPQFTLEAEPESVVAGNPIALTLWSGPPRGPALLAAVEVNGAPTFVVVTIDRFDHRGLWSLGGIVDPSLAGLSVTLRAYATRTDGRIGSSNKERVTIQ